jgi:hypothetical protein
VGSVLGPVFIVATREPETTAPRIFCWSRVGGIGISIVESPDKVGPCEIRSSAFVKLGIRFSYVNADSVVSRWRCDKNLRGELLVRWVGRFKGL